MSSSTDQKHLSDLIKTLEQKYGNKFDKSKLRTLVNSVFQTVSYRASDLGGIWAPSFKEELTSQVISKINQISEHLIASVQESSKSESSKSISRIPVNSNLANELEHASRRLHPKLISSDQFSQALMGIHDLLSSIQKNASSRDKLLSEDLKQISHLLSELTYKLIKPLYSVIESLHVHSQLYSHRLSVSSRMQQWFPFNTPIHAPLQTFFDIRHISFVPSAATIPSYISDDQILFEIYSFDQIIRSCPVNSPSIHPFLSDIQGPFQPKQITFRLSYLDSSNSKIFLESSDLLSRHCNIIGVSTCGIKARTTLIKWKIKLDKQSFPSKPNQWLSKIIFIKHHEFTITDFDHSANTLIVTSVGYNFEPSVNDTLTWSSSPINSVLVEF